MRTISTTPYEADEQRALMAWVRVSAGRYPELQALYHIPNEGKRTHRQGADLRRQGMSKGVPDLCLPVPRNGYGALYIELKRKRGGRLSDDQRRWLDLLNRLGNRAIVCKGWEEAARELRRYLEG